MIVRKVQKIAVSDLAYGGEHIKFRLQLFKLTKEFYILACVVS